MKTSALWIVISGAALVGSGCATNRPKTAAEGQAVFSALQQAVVAAGKKAEPSLALVKVEGTAVAPRRVTIGGVSIPDTGGPTAMSGLMLTAKGHIVVPSVIKPDQDARITVLVGETEYVARAIKTDETLGMTILKLDTEEMFSPLDISSGADLAIGEWAVVLNATDDASDYQKLSTLIVCQGERMGRYRRFVLNQAVNAPAGALVVNLSGQFIGIVERNYVLSINDFREDLKRLLADATGEILAGEEEKNKGWFGALLLPVNKEYAKARKLSPSSLLVLHATKAGPAATAGLRDGDLIVGLNGKPLRLTGARALDYFNKSLRPRTGEKFAVTAIREGKQIELAGTFAKAPEPETLRAEDLGVTVAGITDGELFSQNLPTEHGVLVTDVLRGSPAATSGSMRQTLISRRDIITELAGQPTPNVAAFGKVLETIRRDHPPVVLVKYCRGLLTGYAGLNLALGEKDHGDKQ